MIFTEFFYGAIVIALGAFITLIRVMLGPSVPDRVVGVDTLNTLIVAGMILLGAAYDRVIYIDIAIVYALLSYIGTLVIAKYLQGGLE
ncbi:MAG: multicomponent Na+:H+ antiporter subunit [Thermococcaceae archaeon]|uniref:cation:proton antiporter n=1 Tax=Thermococcus TaxID=2263 RepID=UPI0005B253AA|nr:MULTISPECIES: cation:proton antiporter [Thermococcus]KUJ99125.1 MAG: Putative monovalent cation/H+ antiporter subunit F [Thermococcales archaeon 44_46]MDK2783833.1 multicomponent Na+:H+ antiporter subunit [Thermococcaceae archaeon]MBC7094814.1 cation:proton antiporter [Thermococcus sp.]MCA6214411.1 cation:proton antiporter [Thermococcus bergensis]MDK2853241.1 multicomponent Na+:H+ antiporter subunit [Thermococcaceae archaeon]